MEFPKIKESEYAVLVARCETGVVLDINFNTYLDDSQDIYRIFSNIESVEEFIKKTLEQRENIEIIVYDSNQNMIMFQSKRV